jgi:hypothetical protein
MSAPRKASKRLGELFSLVKAVLLGRPNVSLDNRRQSPRLRLRVPILCKVGTEEMAGELLDISNTGMRVTVQSAVEEEETVRVSAPDQSGLVGRQRLICRVAWVRFRRPDYELGLEYNDSDENVAHSWIQLALKHLDPEQVKRRSRRIPANLYVQVWDAQGSALGRGVCINISTGGCLLQMERHIPKDEVIKMGLGPSEQEASIFLSGRILSHVQSGEINKCLHHMQFFPGENRNHSRLRSLMLTLLEELEHEALIDDEPEVEIEDELENSLFHRLSQPLAAPTPRLPRTTEAAQEPRPGPGPAAPVELGAAPRAEGRPPRKQKPGPERPPLPLSDLIGSTGPLQTRSYELRSTSLWAARNLPVSGQRRNLPKEPPQPPQEPDTPPSDRDFLS